MRVCIPTTSFPSPAYPISGIYLQRMIEALPTEISVTVISPAGDQRDAPSVSYSVDGIRRFRYAPWKWQVLAHKPGGIPSAMRNRKWTWGLIPLMGAAMFLNTLISARKAELIHAQWSFSGLIGGIVGKLCNVPSITTLHGSDVRLAVKSPFYRSVIQWCAKLNARLVTVGDDLADQVQKWLPRGHSRVEVVPNGVDHHFWSARKGSIAEKDIVVIGNLIPSKQVDLVVRAFARLAAHDHRVRLVIIGGGPERRRLQSMADRLSMGERVLFAGQMLPEQVAEQLDRSCILVLASSSEGRPLVVLEAMAAGVPVVASDIGGVRELIGNNERGLLFPGGDAHRLAVCIERILNDPEFGRLLAGNASRWIRARGLTWERTAHRYATLYQQVVAEHRRQNGKRSCAE